MIFPLTNDILFGNNLFVSGNNLIDLKNKLIYKVYKVIQKENFNNLDYIFSKFTDAIIMFKTSNYYADIFSNRIRRIIFKEFSDIDFNKMTQEELENKVSGPLYKKYHEYDEIYKKLEQELEMRSKNLRPSRTIYLFLPINLILTDPKIEQDFITSKNSYFANEQKWLKSIDKSSLDDYNKHYEDNLGQYKKLSEYAFSKFIGTSTNINSEAVIKDEKQLNVLNALNEIEKSGSCFAIDEEELTGLLNSFFYDSIYLAGTRYYNIFNLFNEQIRTLKDGEKYYKLMKLIFKQYNTTVKINNSILKCFNTSNLLFFSSSLKNTIDKDYNLFSTIDHLNMNYSAIIKISERDKDFIIKYLNTQIAKKLFQMENLQKKEEESYASAKNSIDFIKMELDHYKMLKTRVGDEREKVYILSVYFIEDLLNQYQWSKLYDRMALSYINIKQLSPEKTEYRKLFDISVDKSGSFIHTTPLLHYLNFYKPLKNTIILSGDDAEKMSHMNIKISGEQ